MNPTVYQLATAAALRADGDHATADAILALSPDEVADILLGTVTPPPTTFAEWRPYRGPEGGMGWQSDTGEVRYQREKPDDNDGTGGGTDPTRQDISPGVDKAARVLGGATAGGLIGSAVGGPLGMAVGTVAGAAIGTDTAKRVLGGIRDLLNRGEEPEDIARKVTAGDPEATEAVRERARGQVRDAAASLAASEPADPAEVRAGWAQASARMRAGDAAELGGHVEALAGARSPDKVDAAFKAMGGFLARLTGGALRLAFNAIKAFGRFALTTGKPYLVWAASLATGAAVLAAPPVALGLGLIGPATAFALAPVAVGGAIGAGMVGRSAQRAAGGPATFAEAADYTPAGPDGKRAVELLATSQAAGVNTLTEVCDRAVRRLLMLPHPEHAAHLFEDDELHRIAGALAGGIATADLLGRSRVRRRAEMAERVQRFAESDPGPPGAPPRPGLAWKRETQRWVRRGKEHAAELTRRAKDAPAKLKNKVRTYVEKKYAKLAERYGENGAKAVMAASLLLLPVPVPGASFVPIALAEAVRAVGKGAKAVGFAEGDVSDEMVQAVIEFLTELYAEHGEAAPAFDPARVRAALERDEVDEDDQPAETFGEWTRYDGPEGGKGWKNAAGEVRYQEAEPGTEGAAPGGPTADDVNAADRHPLSDVDYKDTYRVETPQGAFVVKHTTSGGVRNETRAAGLASIAGVNVPPVTAVAGVRGSEGKSAQEGAVAARLIPNAKSMEDMTDKERVAFVGSLKAGEAEKQLLFGWLIGAEDRDNHGNYIASGKELHQIDFAQAFKFLPGAYPITSSSLYQVMGKGADDRPVPAAVLSGLAAASGNMADRLRSAGDEKSAREVEARGRVLGALVKRAGGLRGAFGGSERVTLGDVIRATRRATMKFAEPPSDPWHDFAEPVPAVEPAAAVDYFRRLVPTLADDPGRYGLALGRHAFTLAVATEQTVLQKVKDAILAGLRTGTDATADAQDVLDAAGVSPRNPQTAEMIWRTNAMDALNNGAQAEIASPEMQEAFPVIRYDGILDSRTGDDHRPHIGRYYPATRAFADIRGPRVYNCRCSFTPIHRSEAADLIRAGKVERG